MIDRQMLLDRLDELYRNYYRKEGVAFNTRDNDQQTYFSGACMAIESLKEEIEGM